MKAPVPRSRVMWLACGAATAVVLFLPAAQAAQGVLDPNFGSGGKVVTDFGGAENAEAVALQGDGKIVVAGSTSLSSDFAIARYDANGSLDPGFGSGGKVQTDFGGSEYATAVAIQNDGKIVVAGGGSTPSGSDFALARYNVDGSLDATFGGSGKVVTDLQFIDYAEGVAIQSDGKIVAVGPTGATSDSYDFGVVRYNPNGSLDTTFAGGGRVITPFTSINDVARAVVIQPDGKILVVGWGNDGPGTTGFALARYNPDGSLDESFDGDGKVLTVQNLGGGYSVALQSDGKILVAGSSIARFNPDGSLDPSFAVKVMPGRDQARQVLVQPEGNVVVFVTAYSTGLQNGDFMVIQLEPSGREEWSAVTDVGSSSSDLAGGAALQPDRRIVVAGSTASSGPYDFAVARYWTQAPPPVAKCRVPNVRGKTLRAARSTLTRAKCRVGKVKRRASKRIKRGRVISQSPRAGKTLPNRGKVNLVLSRG